RHACFCPIHEWRCLCFFGPRGLDGHGKSIASRDGTVRVVFGAAGVVAGVGSGEGTLTFHGKTYPFKISGASFGATLALTVSEYEGRVLNLRTPDDLAGNYIAVGAGGALAGGIGVARLRNAKGVIIVVRG